MSVNFRFIDLVFLGMYHFISFSNTSVILPITDCEIHYDPSNCNILIIRQIYVVPGESVNQNMSDQCFKQMQKHYTKFQCGSNVDMNLLYSKCKKYYSWLVRNDMNDHATHLHDKPCYLVSMGCKYRFE